MTDRIAELRAMLDYEGALDDTDIDALLDCAEALRALLPYTKACEELLNAMPAGQIRIAEEALAKLNGANDAD